MGVAVETGNVNNNFYKKCIIGNKSKLQHLKESIAVHGLSIWGCVILFLFHNFISTDRESIFIKSDYYLKSVTDNETLPYIFGVNKYNNDKNVS